MFSSSGNKKDQKPSMPPPPTRTPFTFTAKNPAVSDFFQKVTTMLNNYKDILLDNVHQQQQQTNVEKSSTMGKVEAYAMLSECSYAGQVEALHLLYSWFAHFIKQELEHAIIYQLNSVVVASNQTQNNNNNSSSATFRKLMMARIAKFLAAYTKLETFSRICFLALEQPHFLGKYFAPGGAGTLYLLNNSNNNNNSNTSVASMMMVAKNFKMTASPPVNFLSSTLQQRKVSSSSSSLIAESAASSSFIVKTLRGMLRDVAASTLKPFILQSLPSVLHQTRIAKQRKEIAKIMGNNESQLGCSWSKIFKAIYDADNNNNNNNNQVNNVKRENSSSISSSSNAVVSWEVESSSSSTSEEENLAMFSYIVGFFKNFASSSSSSTSSTSSSSSPSSNKHQLQQEEVNFRREFFNPYLEQLRQQFSGLANEMMKKAPDSWAEECYAYLESLVSCEDGISRVLFASGNNNNNNNSSNSSSSHLVTECLRAARGSFVAVCAVPLILEEKNGLRGQISKLLLVSPSSSTSDENNNNNRKTFSPLTKVAKLIFFVATEPDALPQLKKGIEESISKQLQDIHRMYNDTVDEMNKRNNNNDEEISSSQAPQTKKSSAEITQDLQNARINFVIDLLNYILIWNEIISLCCFGIHNEKSNASISSHSSVFLDPASLRITLEKFRRSGFKDILNTFSLKGAQYPIANKTFRTSGAQHVAEALATYCDLLLKSGGDLIHTMVKARAIQFCSNASTLSSPSSPSNDNNNNSNGGDPLIAHFDLITQLVSFFNDKDLVIELHRAKTARRLLMETSTTTTMTSAANANASGATSTVSSSGGNKNLDLECILANKLSHVVDMSQTRKFEGMFADVERWPDEQIAFENYLSQQNNNNNNLDLSTSSFKCFVLTSSKWPAFRTVNLNSCPVDFSAFPTLHQNIFHFEQLYTKKLHPARRLAWLIEPCSAVMSVAFAKGTKEISMNWVQAFALICVDELAAKRQKEFGDHEKNDHQSASNVGVNYEDIYKYCVGNRSCGGTATSNSSEESSNFLSNEINSAIASLALNPKFPILRQITNNSEENGNNNKQRYEVNPAFTIRVKKFTLPKAATAPNSGSNSSAKSNNNLTSDENSSNSSGGDPLQLPKEILAQRDQVLDACIVRLMKSRQRLQMTEMSILVTASIKAFPVTFKQIKRRVEGLMEREFLKREEDDEWFSYIA